MPKGKTLFGLKRGWMLPRKKLWRRFSKSSSLSSSLSWCWCSEGSALRARGYFLGLVFGYRLGLQPIAANFVSGMIILFDRSVRAGDYVVLPDGQEGFVEAINMRKPSSRPPTVKTSWFPIRNSPRMPMRTGPIKTRANAMKFTSPLGMIRI